MQTSAQQSQEGSFLRSPSCAGLLSPDCLQCPLKCLLHVPILLAYFARAVRDRDTQTHTPGATSVFKSTPYFPYDFRTFEEIKSSCSLKKRLGISNLHFLLIAQLDTDKYSVLLQSLLCMRVGLPRWWLGTVDLFLCGSVSSCWKLNQYQQLLTLRIVFTLLFLLSFSGPTF